MEHFLKWDSVDIKQMIWIRKQKFKNRQMKQLPVGWETEISFENERAEV